MNNKVSIFANDVNAPVKVELHENGEYFVSARELHSFLEVLTDFTDWCKRMFEYGFWENRDYYRVFLKNEENLKGGRPSTDYLLTIRCALHIGMVQKTTQGEIIRDYFIACEDRLKNVQKFVVEDLQAFWQGKFDELKVFCQTEINKLNTKVNTLELQNQEFSRHIAQLLAIGEYAKFNINLLQRAVIDLCKKANTLEIEVACLAQWIDEAEKMMQEIMRVYGLESDCFVYVFYNSATTYYKIGLSKHIGKRKQGFATVEKNLKLMFAIPTRSRSEAQNLENMLKKHFWGRHHEGEWYALNTHDLHFLHTLQQAHCEHLESDTPPSDNILIKIP